MKAICKYICLLILSFLFIINVNAQDKTKSYLTFNYYKKTDNSKTLTCKLRTKIDGSFYPVVNETLVFSAKGDTSDVILAQAKTNAEGIAMVDLSKYDIKSDTGGVFYYYVEFEGNDTVKSKSSEIVVKDIELKMSLDVEDSVKTVNISAFFIKDEEKLPVSEVEVLIYVKRLYSNLPIGSIDLDEGEGSLEFPNDLPGDSIGNVVVIAKIEDDSDYANVEQKSDIKWGIPVELLENNYNSFEGGLLLRFLFISLIIVGTMYFVVRKMLKKKNEV